MGSAKYFITIRSVFDYGATAYDRASTNQLQQLDSIQRFKAVLWSDNNHVCLALQVERGEAPLHNVYSSRSSSPSSF